MKRYQRVETPRRETKGLGVTGHSPMPVFWYWGRGWTGIMSRKSAKTKELVPTIAGFSNTANPAIFTGAYLF